MYGFSGYGTNSYGSLRQGSGRAILAVIGMRTVTLLTRFTRTVVALTNQAINIQI